MLCVTEFREAGSALRLPLLLFPILEEARRRSCRESLDCIAGSEERSCESGRVGLAAAVRALLTFRPGACCVNYWSEDGEILSNGDVAVFLPVEGTLGTLSRRRGSTTISWRVYSEDKR